MKLENTKAQMRKGVLELCVLAIVSQQDVYPSDIIERMKAHNLIVVEGTLYPLLNRLKDAELLDYYWKESNAGPPRKYYTKTPQGEAFLEGLKDTWKELNEAVFQTTQKLNIHE